MLKNERLEYIMKNINLHNRVLTSDLVTQLQVSEDTVRRDLQELAELGRLYKVHGGALSKSYHSNIDDSTVYKKFEKIEIARKANKLIHNDIVIIIGGGSTTLELAKHLPKDLKATFYVLSPQIAVELAKYENVEIIVLGGLFSKNSQITYGSHVINQLNEINSDLCILGTSAIHPINGLTDTDWEINQLKKAMINAAKKTAVLCIAEKLNITLRQRICTLDSIDYLVTELNADNHLFKPYQGKNLKII